MATTVADADVLIVADVSKLAADLRKKLDPIMRALNVTLDLLADATSFDNTVNDAVRDADGRTATINVTADTSTISGEVAATRAQISRTPATLRVTVTNVDQEINRTRGRFTKSFDEIGGESGKKFSSSLSSSMTSGLRPLTSIIPSAMANPVVIGVAAIVASLAAIPVAAFLAATAIAGVGLGFLALGAFALRGNEKVAGAFDQMREKISKTFEDAAQPLVEPLVNAFNIIGNAVEKIGPQLEEAFGDLAPSVEKLAEGFDGFIENTMPGLNAAVEAAGPLLDELAKQLPGLGDTFSDFFEILSLGGEDSVDALKIAFDLLDIGLKAIAFTILGLTLAFGLLVDAINLASDAAEGLLIATTGLNFDILLESIKRLTTEGIVTLGDFLSAAKDILGQLPEIFGYNINQATTRGENELRTGSAQIVGVASGIPDQIHNAISRIPSLVSGVFVDAFNQATNATRNGVGSVTSAVRGLASQVVAALSGIASAAYNSGRAIISNLIAGLVSRAGDLARTAAKIVASVKDLLPNSPAKEGPFSGRGAPEVSGRVIADDVAKGLKSGEAGLTAQGNQLVGSLKAQFDGLSLGSSVGQGMSAVMQPSGASSVSNSRTFSPVINVTVAGGEPNAAANAIVRRLLAVGV